jgi:hypothetical protein
MTDEQLKEITDRLDAIQELLGQALTAISENNVKTQESIASAAESITTMQLMYTPPEADDIAQAVVRTLREN